MCPRNRHMATPRRVCCRQTPMPGEGTGARAGVCPGPLLGTPLLGGGPGAASWGYTSNYHHRLRLLRRHRRRWSLCGSAPSFSAPPCLFLVPLLLVLLVLLFLLHLQLHFLHLDLDPPPELDNRRRCQANSLSPFCLMIVSVSRFESKHVFSCSTCAHFVQHRSTCRGFALHDQVGLAPMAIAALRKPRHRLRDVAADIDARFVESSSVLPNLCELRSTMAVVADVVLPECGKAEIRPVQY